MRILSFLLLLTGITFASCKNTKKVVKSTNDNVSVEMISGINNHYFTINQGPCFGRCPVYEISFNTDSTLQLEGKNFMNYIGYYIRKLTPEQYASLMEKYHAIKVAELQEKYDANIADYPMAITYFFSKGNNNNVIIKKVVNAGNAPEELNNLQNEVRQYINMMGWDKDSSRDNARKDELLIQLESGQDINKLLEENMKYGLALRQTVSKDNLIYLVNYDLGKIQQDRMMSILKANNKIKFVDLNPQLKLDR
ncbi:MAG TPA: DUF6438 domain-containing protein [Saprospiraceae bacterium]|nr:DUF6438 domain-containing protein [Saprospiraceae bacterium]